MNEISIIVYTIKVDQTEFQKFQIEIRAVMKTIETFILEPSLPFQKSNLIYRNGIILELTPGL